MLWSKIIFVFKSWKVSTFKNWGKAIPYFCCAPCLSWFFRQANKKGKLQGGEISSNHNSGWEVSSPLEWNVSFGKSLISYVDAPSSISQSLLKYLTQYLQSSIVKDIDSNEPNNLRGCQILDTQNFTQNILLAPPSKLKTSVRQWKWRKTK